MKQNIAINCTLLFLISAAVFYILQFSTPHIIGYDGYHHASMATKIIEQGFVPEQSWWRFGINSGSDLHFLYHYLLVPFVAIFGTITGVKISMVIFAALTVLSVYLWLEYSDVRFPHIFALLTFVSSYVFLYRFTLIRAYGLVIPVLALGYHLTLKRKFLWLFVLAFLFTWYYTAFPLLIMLVLLIVSIRFMQDRKKGFDIKLAAIPIVGSIAGLVINPYFPTNIRLFYVQLFRAMLFPIDEVSIPVDARPFASAFEYFYVCWLVLLLFIIAIVILFLLLRQKKAFFQRCSLLTWVMFILATLFFFFTLSHRRSLEYWFPFTAIFLGSALNDLIDRIKNLKIWVEKNKTKITAVLLIILCGYSIFMVNKLSKAIPASTEKEGLHHLKECSQFVKRTDGALVFSAWDIAPALFFYNPDNDYIVALDPAFLYLYHQNLYRKYQNLISGAEKDPYSVLKNDFTADYVIADQQKFMFANYLLSKQGFKLTARSEYCMVIEII